MRHPFCGAIVVCFLAWAAGPALAGVGMGTIPDDPSVQHEQYKKKAEDGYLAGMKARAAGDQYTAVKQLSLVVGYSKLGIDSPYPEKALAELQAISDDGMKELRVARELVAGEDPAAGQTELKRIVRVYIGLPPAKEAGRLLAQLQEDPKFQSLLREGRMAEDLKKAEALEVQANALALVPQTPTPSAAPRTSVATSTGSSASLVQTPMETWSPPSAPKSAVTASAAAPKAAGKSLETIEAERRAARIQKLLDAYGIYSAVAAQGAGTEPGARAAAAMARLEKDAALMSSLRDAQAERKAREWLGLADGFYKAGRIDTAREYCTKILAECPQTPQAADAKALLERMK